MLYSPLTKTLTWTQKKNIFFCHVAIITILRELHINLSKNSKLKLIQDNRYSVIELGLFELFETREYVLNPFKYFLFKDHDNPLRPCAKCSRSAEWQVCVHVTLCETLSVSKSTLHLDWLNFNYPLFIQSSRKHYISFVVISNILQFLISFKWIIMHVTSG